MRSSTLAVIAVGAVGIVGCGSRQPAPAARARLSAKDIYQQSAGAIVRIDVTDPHGQRVGTGFIVDRNGLVATNLHVVGGSDKIKIKLGNGHEYDVHEIVGYDKNRDLALLRIQSPIALPTIRLGDSDQLIPGDQIVAIGNPLGFENTVSAGLISSVRVFCTPEQAAAQQCPDTNNIDL
jgi:serine protease Do